MSPESQFPQGGGHTAKRAELRSRSRSSSTSGKTTTSVDRALRLGAILEESSRLAPADTQDTAKKLYYDRWEMIQEAYKPVEVLPEE